MNRKVFLLASDDERYLGTVEEVMEARSDGEDNPAMHAILLAIQDAVSEIAFAAGDEEAATFKIEVR